MKVCDLPFETCVPDHMGWSGNMCAPAPYADRANAELIERIAGDDMCTRCTDCRRWFFFGPQLAVSF